MNLQQIIDLSREKADEEASTFIGVNELKSYINQGLKYIYAKLVTTYEELFTVEGTLANSGLFSLVAEQEGYDLPATLLKLVNVQMRSNGSVSANDYFKLDRLNIANNGIDPFYPVRNNYLQQSGYFVVASKIYFRPVPTNANQIRLWFVPKVIDMDIDTDIPGIPSEYHEILAEYASIQCLRKSGEGIFQEAYKIWQDELQNMLDSAKNKDQQAATMVITDDWDSDYNRYGI